MVGGTQEVSAGLCCFVLPVVTLVKGFVQYV